MERTAESVAAEVAALKQALKEVSAAIDNYSEIATRNVGNKDARASGEVRKSHKELFLQTNKLLTTVRGPVDTVISNFENVSTRVMGWDTLVSWVMMSICWAHDLQSVHTGCLRAVMEMGIFEALPMDGSSATAETLSKKLGVEKDLIGGFEN
jgi:hypothetical protein